VNAFGSDDVRKGFRDLARCGPGHSRNVGVIDLAQDARGRGEDVGASYGDPYRGPHNLRPDERNAREVLSRRIQQRASGQAARGVTLT
jgi:hypothetical protein